MIPSSKNVDYFKPVGYNSLNFKSNWDQSAHLSMRGVKHGETGCDVTDDLAAKMRKG